MNRASRNRSLAASTTEIQVLVKFIVTIMEVHSRTGTICDKQTGSCQYEFGDDFTKAKHWLESDHSWAKLGSFANEACERWINESGEKR